MRARLFFAAELQFLQILQEVLDIYDFDVWKGYGLQHIKMVVIRNNVFGISLDGAIDEFVIVLVCLNEFEVVIHLDMLHVAPVQDG